MDIIRYIESTKFSWRWHYCNVFHYYPKSTMQLLLKHTFTGQVNFTDIDRKEITYLVQKGLTPYQATVTECWTAAKHAWDFEEDCEFGCGYDCGRRFLLCSYEHNTCDSEFICKCRCQCKNGCVCEKTMLNRLYTRIKGGVEDSYALENLLIVLHNGKENLEYIPMDITDWASRHHTRFELPTMKSLFDISKKVVLRDFKRNDVNGILPPMMIDTLYGVQTKMPSNLRKQTVVTLRQLACERKLKGYCSMNKKDLINLLTPYV